MIGSTVGPYEVLSRLGAGGMGEVFLGRDPRLQRQVALKRVTAAGAARANVLREARAAARLSHPHIAAIYDVLEADDTAFIVMEYVDGESLSARIARGPLPPGDVAALGRQLASAVAAAHAQGVIHRDLKPSNIQLTRAGSAKILDFGVAKISPPQTSAPTTAATLATATLAGNPGTPAYMAPEQLAGRGADERSDVYALGAVLFEMATGARPYGALDVFELAMEIAEREPRAATALNPEVPSWLAGVIARALKRNPAERYQSAREMEEALAAGQAAPARLPARLGARVAIAVAVLAGLAVLAIPMLRRATVGRGRPARPAIVAVLPVDNPTGDSQADYFGAGLGSIVAQNLGSIQGLTLLSRAATSPLQTRRNDLAAFRRELGADYVLDVMITSAAPSVSVVARLKPTAAAAPPWQRTISGDALTVEKRLLSDVATELEARALGRRLTDADWARITRLPTTSGAAFSDYSEARALLDQRDATAAARAIDLLTRALAVDPRFGLAHAALADAYWAQYQQSKDPALVTRATAEVDAALRIDPDQGPVYASLATMYQQTGRYEDAIKAARRAIELQPDSDEHHRLLARVFIAKGDYAAAADEMRVAIGIRPFWSNYFGLGAAEYQAGNYSAALDAYRRTTELNPDFPGGFQALGTVLHVLGDLPQAIGNYEHSVRLSPDVPQAHNNLGLAYYTAGRYVDALDEFKRALALRPNNALYFRNIADAQRSLGATAEARTAYESAIRLSEAALKVNPRDIDAIGLIAICEARLGRTADAERHVAELLAIAPENRNALLPAAQVHTILNRPDAALRELGAAIAHGYSRRMARMDDDLKPLRRLPGFEPLVADDTATPPRR